MVTAGDQYAVVVRSDYPTDTTDMRWSYASAAPYPDGTAQARTVPGGPSFLQAATTCASRRTSTRASTPTLTPSSTSRTATTATAP